MLIDGLIDNKKVDVGQSSQILIIGGTGAIGRCLILHLLEFGYEITVVSRQAYPPANLPAQTTFAQWDGQTAAGWGHLVEGAEAVVNLAGTGIADERWSEARKKAILDSRLQAGQGVVEAIGAARVKPKVLIQASAVGYYGAYSNGPVFTEENQPGDDFLARICRAWEASTEPVEAVGVRRVVIRTGVVLDRQGGALPKLVLPFRFFVGGPIGSGRQWFPWIHHYDEVAAIRFLIESEMARGPVNLTAPAPLRNRDLVKIIGKVLNRPAFVPVPSLVLKMMLGEMSTVLLEGQQVLPRRLTEWGYRFRFPEAEAALRDLFGA